jgi:monoamine oxidase
VRERRIGRVVEGYGAVVDALAEPVRDRIRFGTVVRSVRWRRGVVAIEWTDHGGARRESIEARRAIVGVPLGVITAPRGSLGHIEFTPALATHVDAASRLAMGTVVRVVLQFDEPFWSDEKFARHIGDERFDTMSFLHARSDVTFPVWWSQYPIRAPVLVGWRGGPEAARLSRRARTDVIAEAMRSLATILSMTSRSIEKHVVAAFMHDWDNDPFTRGTYSYATVGGDDAATRLARSVQSTLFFAGEHADEEGRNGTVHGAIASGWRAADQILRSRR